MKILIVHNRYRSALPSGENTVVDGDVAMLRSAGVDVETYIRNSDEIAQFGLAERFQLATRPIYSIEDTRKFKTRIQSLKPDIVHLHNVYPLISPGVIRVAKAEGIPVVQTVHNYRFVCANGIYFRNGSVCQDCLGKRVPWPAVAHGCYRGSRTESAIIASSLAIHRSTWQMVDRFIAISDLVAEQLEIAGVSPNKIAVKRNTSPDPGKPGPIGTGFLFVGRLEIEKGINLLLEAWGQSGLGKETTLTVAGDGAEKSAVQHAARSDSSILFLGAVPAYRVGRLLDNCAVSIVPSLWLEAFPLATIESFARGRPVISVRSGSNEIVVSDEVGWVSPATAPELAETMQRAFADTEGVRARGAAARKLYELAYLPEKVVRSLLEIYMDLSHDEN